MTATGRRLPTGAGRALCQAALGALLCLVMTGCSSTSAPAKVSPLPRIQATVFLSPLWRSSADAPAAHDGLQPAVLADRLIVAGASGQVTAFARDSGKVLWKRDIGHRIGGGPGAGADRRILLGTRDGHVLALDSRNGKPLWITALSSEVLSVPQVAEGRVIVQTADSTVTCLDLYNGKRLWEQDSLHPVLALRGAPTPRIAGGIVYTGFANGRARAWQLDSGQPLWDSTVALATGTSELERMVDIHAQPQLDSERVYMVSYQGKAAAMDRATGQLLWSRDASSYQHMALDADHLYISDTSGTLQALDLETGAPVWRQEAFKGRGLTTPALAGRYLVAGDALGFVHVFTRADGRPVGRRRADRSAIRSQPRVVNGKVYVQADDGDMIALRLLAPG